VVFQAAAATSEPVAPQASHLLKETHMMGIEWLKPAVFFGSILYALIGVLVFWISFVIVDKVTPYDLWGEIIEKKNVALAIVVGAMCIAIGLIVAAAIHD
jgi:putative membrane protein